MLLYLFINFVLYIFYIAILFYTSETNAAKGATKTRWEIS